MSVREISTAASGRSGGIQSAGPRWLPRSWPRDLLVLPPVLCLIVLTSFLQPTDSDYWWHIRTGQYIVDTGTLPREDLFSYTARGHPWVTHEWLSEVVLYATFGPLGYAGNVLLFALLSALTWIAVYATCRLHGLGELGALLLMMACFAVSLGALNVRVQVVTMLLLATTAWLLTRYRLGERRALWVIPPLLVLWVNLHGGYVVGLGILGLTVVGEALAHLLRQPAAPLRPLVVGTALATLATLLNPHGVNALLYPFSYAGAQNASRLYVAEWQSPDFHQPYFMLFAGLLLLTMCLGLGLRPLGPTDLLWAVAFTLMALQSARHIPLCAIILVPLVAARLQSVLPALRRPLARWRQPAGPLLLWPPLIAACLVLVLESAEQGKPLQLRREPDAAGYPAAAVAYLRERAPEGNLFNEYLWGGYLIYELYPGRQVFIDGRADVYGDALMEAFMAVATLRPEWHQVLDRYDVRIALIRKDGPLSVMLRDTPGWERLYADDLAEIYRRP
ncbi:MAG TPA: hypothetical protein VII06_33445 [Chloroflexota bacterium]